MSGSGIEVIRYQSELLRYPYRSYSISKFTFCIFGPMSKIYDIEDLNLRYRSTGNGYIVPYMKDLQYQGFLYNIEIIESL